MRNKALDFVKGLLVLGMLAYHSVVFFLHDEATRNFLLGTMLDFISGSWVFISGLIVSVYYSEKFRHARFATTTRLWGRGVKIMLIFALLNGIIAALGLQPERPTYDLKIIERVLVYGDGFLASFEILIGIGYVLFMAPLVLFLGRFGLIAVLMLLMIINASEFAGHKTPPNLWIVSCGLGGIVLGTTIRRLAQRERELTSVTRIWLATLMLVGIAIYYNLRIWFGYGKGDILVYLVGITCILAFFYFAHPWFSQSAWTEKLLLWLGQYSLVSYIGQMAIVWAWYRLSARFADAIPFVVHLLLSGFLMVLLIALVDYLRNKSRVIQRTYGFFFG